MLTYIIERASSDELYHFGIFGQRWGVRRYENKDGTLTTEGKERYYNSRNKRLTEKGKQRFFKNESSNLSKAGNRILNKGDKDINSAINVEKFERNYSNDHNWLNAYNKATDQFNIKIDDLNKKYNNDPFKDKKTCRKYVKDVGKLWTGLYDKVLLDNFGEHPTIGKSWVNNTFNHGMYDNVDELVNEFTKE